MTIHNEIMNIPCEPIEGTESEVLSFKLGHKQARHAAAELAARLSEWQNEAAALLATFIGLSSRPDELEMATNHHTRSEPPTPDLRSGTPDRRCYDFLWWPERREMAGLMLEDKLCSRERERLADLRT